MTYERAGVVAPGALLPGGDVLDLAEVLDDGGAPARDHDLTALLAAGALPRARALVEAAEAALAAGVAAGAGSVGAVHPIAEVRLLAPVRPGKLLCIGYNYRGHEADGQVADPEFPDVFVKTANTVVGPQDAVVVPRASGNVDYEAEVGIVVGSRCHEVDEAEALDHVAGYTIVNDVSARDWQGRTSQWALGKSFDTFAPLGPALVTTDEVGDPHALEVTLRHNGRLTVSSSTARMVFSMAFLVSYLSQVMTLEPGDVIATGTPQKLPEALAAPAPMRPGDVVEITVSRLGTLRTAVVAPSHPDPSGAARAGRPR
ncbi:fumarylacetoacetate hydrolase family protein [Serinibacter arcticus]|uniref:fumarylacetoacetate hydrolase family protein n=1 Tax=Serinibacter arcticus TaxID=1655435 RepID=UPI001F23F00E|nr:fumarylacetoacetate hydrolase family protein [Serinibacter arcticus]